MKPQIYTIAQFKNTEFKVVAIEDGTGTMRLSLRCPCGADLPLTDNVEEIERTIAVHIRSDKHKANMTIYYASKP